MSEVVIRTLAAVVMLMLSAAYAQAGTRMTMQCQQNTQDHRTLVANGNMLPENSAFKIVTYKPVRRDGDWTYGPCVLNVTKDTVD